MCLRLWKTFGCFKQQEMFRFWTKEIVLLQQWCNVIQSLNKFNMDIHINVIYLVTFRYVQVNHLEKHFPTSHLQLFSWVFKMSQVCNRKTEININASHNVIVHVQDMSNIKKICSSWLDIREPIHYVTLSVRDDSEM